MSKNVLILSPENEIHFKGLFNRVVTTQLKLTNPTDRRICFKVKNSDPKCFAIRPNTGVVEGMACVVIDIDLMPSFCVSCDRFMVQSTFAPEGDLFNEHKVWKDVNPTHIMETQLRCAFDLSVDFKGDDRPQTSCLGKGFRFFRDVYNRLKPRNH